MFDSERVNKHLLFMNRFCQYSVQLFIELNSKLKLDLKIPKQLELVCFQVSPSYMCYIKSSNVTITTYIKYLI